MSQKFLRLEITDICDELSEDLRRELIERQVICVSKLDSNRNEISELKNDIKRLKSDLKFANKCLITLNKFKKYLNEIRPQIENDLDLRQKQELITLEIEYQLMIKKINDKTNPGTASCSHTLIDEDLSNEKIEFDDNTNEEFTETNDYSNNNKVFNTSKKVLTENQRNLFSGRTVQKSINSSYFRTLNSENNQNSKNKRTGWRKYPQNSVVFKFKCEECYYRTNNETLFESHKRSHFEIAVKGVESLYCEICDKSFANRNRRNEHFSAHHKDLGSGNRQLECMFPDCYQKFKHKNQKFRDHMERHLFDLDLTAFKCELLNKGLNVCKYQTKDYNELKKHELRTHSKTEERHNICNYPTCKRAFYFIRDLRLHIHEFHSVPEYKCLKCNKKCILFSRLRDHLRKRHKLKVSLEDRHKYQMSEEEVRALRDSQAKNRESVEDLLSPPNTGVIDTNVDQSNSSEGNDLTIDETVIPSAHEICFENEFVNEVEVVDENGVKQSEQSEDLLIGDNVNEIVTEDMVITDCTPKTDDQNVSKPVFNCEKTDCDFETHSQYLLDIHKKVHKKRMSLVCHQCNGRIFKTSEQMSQHLRIHRRGTVKCLFPQCGQTPRNMFQHMNKHLKDWNKSVFRCETIGCEYETKNYNYLNKHQTIGKHKKKRQTFNPCLFDGCGLVFDSREQLYGHYSVHKNANNNFQCDFCGFEAQTYSVLKIHRNKHIDERQFKCDYCSKTFKTKNNAEQHMNALHIKIEKYSCPYEGCDQKFFSYPQKAKHIMKEHKKIKQRFPCDWPDCAVVLSTKYSLIEHRRKHTGEMPHICNWPECGKRFAYYSSFESHMRIHTNDRRYTCDWPGCEFTHHDRGARRMHRLRHQKDLEEPKKLVLKLNIKKSAKSNPINIKTKPKRKITKPKRYESDESYSD